MSRMRRTPVIFAHALILLPLLATGSGPVFARVDSVGVPENARAKEYGNGWECERGFREVNKSCVAVKVPPHGYLTDTSYGSGWECERGFRAVRKACVAVVVPEHAYLDSSGTDWECNRPYNKRKEKCTLP